MPITEGTTALPVDMSGRRFWGLFDGSVFRMWRGNGRGAGVIAVEKGTRLHFKATPGSGSALVLLAANAARRYAAFTNAGSVVVYVSTLSGVTSVTGTPIQPGQSWDDEFGTEDWYGIAASGTGDIRGWEVA